MQHCTTMDKWKHSKFPCKNWFEMVNDKDSNAASSELIKMFQQLVFKYSKGKKVKPKGKIPLPWLNDNLWKLMRTRDSALKKVP